MFYVVFMAQEPIEEEVTTPIPDRQLTLSPDHALRRGSTSPLPSSKPIAVASPSGGRVVSSDGCI